MLAPKEVLLVVAIVNCLGSLCLSAPSNNGRNSNQNNNNSGRNNNSGQNNGSSNRVINISRDADGRIQIRERTTETRTNGTATQTTRTWQSGQPSGPMGSSRVGGTIGQQVGNRDYVETDRDYQNLLDLLRREAEEEEERRNNLKNFVPDNVSVEEIERLFAAATTEPSFALDSAESDSDDGDDPESDCPICLESMAESEKSMPQCRHRFHATCLGKWISQAEDGQSKCPVCRSSIIKTLKIRRKAAASAKIE